MSAFLSHLDERCLDDAENDYRGLWELLSPLKYQSDIAGCTFVVPAGERSDHASVPRLPIIFLLFGEVNRKGAWIHDYLYRTGVVSRSIADAILKEACLVSGVSGWRAYGIWLGVRVGGSRSFMKAAES